MRFAPDLAQQGANLGVDEIGQEDAVRARIREREIGFAGAGEFAVKLDGVADIDDDEKRRPALGDRQGAGILFGLPLGLEHRHIPALGAAHCRAAPTREPVAGLFAQKNPPRPPFVKGGCERSERGDFVAPLLGLQNETAMLVKIDAADAGHAGAVAKGDRALEDVGVIAVIRAGGVGARDAQKIAEFGKEELVISALGSAGVFPAADEISCISAR